MTQEELAKELAAAVETLATRSEIEPGTITRREYETVRGVGSKAASLQLDRLAAAGVVERCRTRRANAWGVVTLIPGYRLLPDGSVKGA